MRRFVGAFDTRPLTGDADRLARRESSQPHLVLVLQRDRLRAGGARYSLAGLDRVTLGRGATRSSRRFCESGTRTLAIHLPDTRMSSGHAILERHGDTWSFQDCGSTNGSRVGRARVTRATLEDGDRLELGRSIFSFRAALPTPANAVADVDAANLPGLLASFGTLVPRLSSELETLARVARSDVPVLLLGETGTGKEVLARAVHAESGRQGPFVAVNCGALPSGLVESLLFGHKKGAFSGASNDELGFVRAAHGGTLLLDEIGDLAALSQASLLRVLQEREVVPVGSTRPVAADVRVLAATHRPLVALVDDGSFRADLYARLSAFTFTLPSLRDRRDDLGLLVAAILPRVAGARAGALVLSEASADALLSHDWPLNVRELEQRMKVAAVLAEDDRLELNMARSIAPATAAAGGQSLSAANEALRAELIAKLIEHEGNVTHVSAAMGKPRPQVHRSLKRLGVDAGGFRR